MTHYNLQSDHLTHINLEAPLENLKWHQQRLQKLAAAVAMDLSVVTEAVVEKQHDNNAVDKYPRAT